MTTHEALSRLRNDDLPPEEAAHWRARIAEDPEVSEAWEALVDLDAELSALLRVLPPPALDARILGHHPTDERESRFRWSWVTAGLLAALVVFVVGGLALRPGSSVRLWLLDDGVRIAGRARVGTEAARIEIDGEATVRDAPLRAEVIDGRAEIRTRGGTTILGPGERWRIEAPVAPTPAAPPVVDETSVLQDRIRELELQVRLLEEMVEQQNLEYEGRPMAWPEGLPEALQPAGFERQVREAVESCAPDLEILDFDCREPPCFAQLRTHGGDWWNRLVNECPAWTDHYGNAVASASFDVTCDDGSKERGQMLGWSWHVVEDTHPLDEKAKENYGKRFDVRVRESIEAWPCQAEEGE